jgi:hypothetical protein
MTHCDPLGSALFALSIHPILLRSSLQLGTNHPKVLFATYANSIFLSGPLSLVKLAYAWSNSLMPLSLVKLAYAYCQALLSVSLLFNARESELYTSYVALHEYLNW